MNRLITIGSGSSGNCYILECDNEVLIIELGVQFKEVLKHLDYDLTKVRACLVSHQHLDHAKYIQHALEHALPVYSCQDVADKYKRVSLLKLGEKVQIGGFKIQPISVPHSCECYAYLIEHSAIGRMLFCTDCKKFSYKMKNLNHIFIECNYDEELVIDNLCDDKDIRSMFGNHMEVQNTIEALRNNYGPSLQNICLLHLSSGNAHPKMFKEMIRGALGFDNVFIAEKGLEIPLEINDF